MNALLVEPRLMPLGPGRLDPSAKAALQAFDPLKDLGQEVVNRDAALACHAGLWLYFDGLDESHAISQDLNTREGHFWHAVMHRREPDPDNSKYWWRRVGSHAVFDRLRARSGAIGYTFIGPEDFVDYCEGLRDTGTTGEELAQRVQLLEWELLFDYCQRIATGG